MKKIIKTNIPWYATIPITDQYQDENTIVVTVIQILLNTFEEFFLEDLTNSSTLLRVIHHNIDLPHSSSSPKLTHCKISPDEHQELKIKFLALIEKGFIR